MTPPIFPSFDPTDDRLGNNISRGFHLLRAKRRRQVVWCMEHLDPDQSITVRELGKEITAAEQNLPVQAVSNDDYRSVYTNLVQRHLPALNDANVVDYDSNRKTVSPGPNTEVLVMLSAISMSTIHLLLEDDFE